MEMTREKSQERGCVSSIQGGSGWEVNINSELSAKVGEVVEGQAEAYGHAASTAPHGKSSRVLLESANFRGATTQSLTSDKLAADTSSKPRPVVTSPCCSLYVAQASYICAACYRVDGFMLYATQHNAAQPSQLYFTYIVQSSSITPLLYAASLPCVPTPAAYPGVFSRWSLKTAVC